MGREEQIIGERIRKLKELKDNGIDPYPHKYSPNAYSIEIKHKYSKLSENERTHDKIKVAGRVMTARDLGKLIFITIQDAKGRIQLILQKEETEKESFELFKKYFDTGDFIGAEGFVMKTKTGEVSILVKKLEMLSKAILPLPEKWHGIQDKEERYRRRYLDLIVNPDVKEVFEKRSIIIDSIRELLKKKGFIETDTPYLQTLYGGASAKPFETYLNALDMKLYLAVSPELFLKRLIVGGYDKVFTIARNFRNEGIDRWHNPEFTMMEIYCAYAAYNDMMELTEVLYENACLKANGTTKVNFRGVEIDFKKPWKRMTMADAIKKFAGIDVLKMNEKELKEFVKKNHVESKYDSWGFLVQAIFEHFCEEKLEQPTFITDHPVETTPLCKLHRNDKTGRLIERFEPFCMGTELANAYTELNDPILQRKLLEDQQKMLSEGNDEANPLDEDFINAIETGMPPTGGLGIGIDRMVILLTGQESIRDIIYFPFMKPEVKLEENQAEKKETKQVETNEKKHSEDKKTETKKENHSKKKK
ncbi:MAG: lysine--tRNA ligase [Candidatus Pacearchaeota archaeon]|jgi:lysyl-tRNA synthetase class 2